MLHIILLILKIIGIVLLCLLGFLLLMVCLVLFVPVRYRIAAERIAEPESNYAKAKITWLLHIVSASISYENEEVKTLIRLFGIKLNLNKEKKEKNPRKNKKKRETDASEDTELELPELESTEPEISKSVTEQNPDTADEPVQVSKPRLVSAAGTGNEKKKQSFFSKCREFFGKLLSFIKNFKKKIKRFFRKIVAAKDNLDYYIAAWEDERNQNAIRLCLSHLGKILHNIKPKKFKAALHIGLEDPASMGQLLAVLGIIYPFFEGGLSVTPEFLESVFEGDLYIKGRATVFVMLRAAWKIYFNKDFKRMIHILKKEAI